MKYRPLTTVILAMTADGKIADERRSPARFSSVADKAHLEEQISLVDAVLFGASTLRAYGTTLPITNPDLLQQRKERSQPPQPVHIVCSASGKIYPQLRFFSQPVPRWLLTTATGAKLWQLNNQFECAERVEAGTDFRLQAVFYAQRLRGENFPQEARCFHQILTVDTAIPHAPSIDWIKALTQLKLLGIEKLAILGGGELVASLLKADLIDEFWLTICPVIFGGREAPTPVEGIGFSQQQGQKLELLNVKQVGQEVFLHYRLQH
ncbi:RibD family protein [Pleurocapsales cyanobacterium LEGE 06147]|nr:RibD family protein [Pleurocapsales cyanobacterium LEGE 06147]